MLKMASNHKRSIRFYGKAFFCYNTDMKQEIKLGKYRHFKGHDVEVIGVANHSENPDEEFVVYRHEHNGHNLWIRPLDMFLENIEREGYSGPRFEYIEG